MAGDLTTYKYLTDNSCERDVFEKYPSLRDSVRTIDNNQQFIVEDGLTIEAIYTPGHTDDHLSFLIQEEKTLICGDIILGAPSTAIQDLDAYFTSLGKIQQMDLEWLLLPHSVALNSPELVMVPAREKIAQYVDYRVTRMNQLLDCFNSTNQQAAAQSNFQERSR